MTLKQNIKEYFTLQSNKNNNFWFYSSTPALEPATKSKLRKSLNHQQGIIQEFEDRLNSEVQKNEQKEVLLQLQSRQAQMGEMISSITHQWKQPLNALSMEMASFMLQNTDKKIESDAWETHYQSMMKIIYHMSNTLDCFRDFLRPSSKDSKFSLFLEIQKIIVMIENLYSNNGITITVKGDRNVKVTGHSNQFQQVILNLLQNARDAILEKKSSNRSILINVYHTASQAMVDVSDFAGGVPEELNQKIFDPYFTTKPPGKGTGIGLYMSKAIIDKMKGSISVSNNNHGTLYAGAIFKIQLPLATIET